MKQLVEGLAIIRQKSMLRARSVSSNFLSYLPRPYSVAGLRADSIDMSSSPERKCTICNREASRNPEHHCDKCAMSWYCSSFCKEEDQSQHRFVCFAIRSFIASNPRPSPVHRLAVGLPTDGTRIRFGWYMDRLLGDIPPNLQILQQDLCGFEESYLTTMIDISQKLKDAHPGFGRFELDHRVEMVMQRGGKGAFVTGEWSTLTYELSINPCVKTIFQGAKRKEDWRGPIVLLSRDKTQNRYRDITVADFRVLFDILGDYSYSFEKGQSPLVARTTAQAIRDVKHILKFDFSGNNHVKGVRVNCLGDKQFLNADHMIPQNVSRHHDMFKRPPTSISMWLGLPLITIPLDEDKEWSETRKIKGYRLDLNTTAKPLNIIVNIKHENFCSVLPKWLGFQGSIGSFCVVRADRRSITPNQVEAFAEFGEKYLAPLFIELNEQIEECAMSFKQRHRRIFIEDHINREVFEQWFEVYKADKIMRGFSSWIDTESPYTT